VGINGGAENCIVPDDDDDDSDEDEDKEELNGKGPLQELPDVLLATEECSSNDVQHTCIAQDLDNIAKCNLFDIPIEGHIEEFHKLLFKRLPSTTIPLYQHAENDRSSRCYETPFSSLFREQEDGFFSYSKKQKKWHSSLRQDSCVLYV